MPARRSLRYASVLLACLTAAAWAIGPDEPLSPHALYLRSTTIDTTASANLLDDPPAEFAAPRYVIQTDGPMTPERRAALERIGVVLGDYLPLNAWIASLENTDPRDLADLPWVRWVAAYRNEWKLDAAIGTRTFESPARRELADQGLLDLTVTLFSDEPLEPAVAVLGQLGSIVDASRVGRHGVIDVVVPAARLADLADLPFVQFVEETPEPVFRNDAVTWVMQTNIPNSTTVWDHGIHGEGQMGGLIDGAVRESHCDFMDLEGDPIGDNHRKIQAWYGPGGSDIHGTHTGGTLLGDHEPVDGSTFRNGMAYRARLVFTNLSTITGSNLYSTLVRAHGDGARAHSNSWGDDGTTQYTSWCQQIDQYSWEFEDGMVAFAVTNTSTLKTPENAKNVLAVGATQRAPNQEQHCTGGRGPTRDGRRKPEVYLPGCSTQSASSSTSCGWRSLSGTSMACPAVTGAALLVRQYFTDGFYPSGTANPADAFVPSGSLIRAVVINSAQDMTGVGGYPSDTEGWGRVLLEEALYFVGDARNLWVHDVRMADGLNTGQSEFFDLEVLSSAEPLRITLVWADPPAAVNSGFPPINDLDLVVTAPDGTRYLGNDFNTATGESRSGGVRDDRNNIEQVHRKVPLVGIYQVEVRGTAVNQGPQGYALVATGSLRVEQTIPGDFDGDGDVDLADFATFAACFTGSDVPCTGDCCDADLDRDGDVDIADFGIFTANFTGSQ